MIESAHVPAIPIGLAEIFRIIDDTATPLTTELNGPALVSALTEVMQSVSDRAETAARSFDAHGLDNDAFEVNAVENRLLGVHDNFSSLNIPSCLEWSDIGHDVAALSPPALRAGVYYPACSEVIGSEFFLRTIMWDYLASRFAFHRIASLHMQSHGSAAFSNYSLFQQSKRAVVSAARFQRRVLKVMHLEEENLNGQCFALAMRRHPTDDEGACLFAINDLGAEQAYGAELVKRASAALDRAPYKGISHAVIFTNSLNSTANTSETCLPLTGVHVLSEPDQVRYVFVVSRVSDHVAHELAKNKSNSSVGVSKPRLRDVFWRQKSVSSLKSIDETRRQHIGGDYEAWPDSFASAADLVVGNLVRTPVTERGSTEVRSEEPTISRTKLARKFFGYQGLKTPSQ